MLEEFDREVDHTDSRMQALTARVNKAIKKSGSKFIDNSYLSLTLYSTLYSLLVAGKCQLITILILIIILIIVIICFFIPF